MKDEQIRLTKTTIAVLELLLAATDDRPLWGQYIAHAADMEPSSVSAILRRLRELGWVESWDASDGELGGYNRRFHELTPVGYQRAMKALMERQERRRKVFRSYQ